MTERSGLTAFLSGQRSGQGTQTRDAEAGAGQERLASDLAAMTRIQEVATRLVRGGDPAALLGDFLDAAIAIAGCDRGNVQILEGGALRIVAQRGFSRPFLDFFAEVREDDAAACGRALATGERQMVEDARTNALFRGSPALSVLEEAGVRAVLTTPLVSRSGQMLGVFSLHSSVPRSWSDGDLRFVDLLARLAADWVERKRGEEARRALEASLRDAARRKDEFLAMLAHELRNPLAPIKNSVQILRLSGAEPAAVERVLDILDRQVGHMVRLVDDLMEVSRISRGIIEVRKSAVPLSDVLRSAIETARPLIDAERHTLELDLPAETLLLDGDAVRLAQIFANLLNNAARYTEPGGTIRVSARRERGAVAVSVRDSGIGIAAEDLPRVFESFTQLGGDSRGRSGLGLGLSLVRRLAELHGGSVQASSPGPGRGSEFVVTLPLHLGASPAATTPPPAARPAARRVLVVDDNRDAAESLASLLRISGADARVVYDGATALSALEGYRPGMVLLDLGMPGMDGFEVARRIRGVPGYASVPIVAVTGWAQDDDRERAREAGFDRHIVKPADLRELEALLIELDSESARA